MSEQQAHTKKHLEALAQRLLSAIGGGQLRVMKRGEQTIAQRAQELAEEDARKRKHRW
jgi:hypothetical protein